MRLRLRTLTLLLGAWVSAGARGDFVSYNLFGTRDPASVDSKITAWGLAAGLELRDPIVVQTFDTNTEFRIDSTGWWQVNYTDPVAGHTTENPNDPLSNSYLGWVPISRTRLESVFGSRRLGVAPSQVVNGQAVTELLSGNLLYAESDLRSGDQVQYLFSPIYNLAGQRGVVLAFHSAYEQNQDSVAGVEYTIDGGNTWRPILYLVDRDDLIHLPDGQVDAVATLTTRSSDIATYLDPDSGQTVGGYYGAFLAAPIAQDLAPFLSGRINDDAVESKRVEVFRIPLADDQPAVQFRLFQGGTASWYWGIDSWGLYRVPYVETVQGFLKDYANGSTTTVTLTLSVAYRGLSPQLSTRIARPLQPGTDAAAAFPIDLSPVYLTLLPAARAHSLTVTGLDPAKTYELVLFSDLGTGTGATGTLLSYTLFDAAGFRNESSFHPTLATLAGAQQQTSIIDVTDNSRADRGFVCRFTAIRSGPDGDIRVALESDRDSCLTALKLVETTPQAIAIDQPPQVTATGATLTATVQTEDQVKVYVAWGRNDGGTSPASWEHVDFLGDLASGQVASTLSGLDTFRKYYYAFFCSNQTQSVWTQLVEFRPQVQGVLYATGFEPDESTPFAPGALQGQDRRGIWRVSQGTADVQQTTIAHGLQAVQAGEGAIEVSLTNSADVLWVDAFFREAGSTNPPIVPTNLLSSALSFSATQGILALDGDGQGHGSFVPVVADFPKDCFVRVTIRNDYAAKRYDVWIDGVLRRAGLGFKDNSVAKFSGAQRRSVHSNYMDDFSVSIWGLDSDSDGDGLVDLDEAKFYGSYALLADSDRDGAFDGQEVLAGTDPADETSVFALRIELGDAQQRRIRLPTITGLQYTLQRRQSLNSNPWEPVPGATDILGDGTEKVILETSDGKNYFYRGVIVNR